MNKKKSSTETVTTPDLTGISLDEMLTETYGNKRSSKRQAADKRTNELASTLILRNTIKELRESLNFWKKVK
jgi:hypothetical protein